MNIDLAIVQKFAYFASIASEYYGYKDLDFTKFTKHFVEVAREELDFRHEVKNGERARHNLRHLDSVYIPKNFTNLCTKRVITM